MFRMLVHPSSGAFDLFVELFHGLYCSGSMCVGVTVWFGWVGVVSGCRLKPGAILFVIIAWITIHFGRKPRNGGSPPKDRSDVNIMNFISVASLLVIKV